MRFLPALLVAIAAGAIACEPAMPVRYRINDDGDDFAGEGEGEPGEGEGDAASEGEGEAASEGEGEGEVGEGEGEGEGEVVDGELRGLWITRFAFANEADLRGIIDRAAAAKFNAVFVQIRGNGDAYYDSNLEPWARGLSGVLGRDPGWDPLAVAIEHGHGLGLEVHAYFNALSAWPSNAGLPPTAEGSKQHMLVDHPEWIVVDAGGDAAAEEYYWVTPGNADVRAHTAAVARDLLERYDVDGLHLDRIRSPGPQYSHDDVTEAAFAASGMSDYGDFMRTQVTQLVSDIYDVMLEVRPDAKLSAAVWGIHTRLPGCSTSQGSVDYHQDSWAWMDQGVIDALAPMTYWEIEDGACTDWAALADGFLAASNGRPIWMGMHALDDGAFDIAKISSRVDYARSAGAAGTMVFASTYLDQGGGDRWTQFANGPFIEQAPVPSITWRE